MKPQLVLTEGNDFSCLARKILERKFELATFENDLCFRSGTDRTLALMVRLGYRLDEEFIKRFPKLKIIASPTTGLDHIDTQYCESIGVKVISLKGEIDFLNSIPSTAEFAFGLIISLYRNIPQSINDVKNGFWRRDQWRGNQLKGKTLGLIGFGRIGKMLANYGKAFGMNVVYYDPFISSSMGSSKTFEELVKSSDAIVNCVALNSNTKGLIKLQHFEGMKRTAIFVNIARAAILEEGALLTALQSSFISGAAIDVIENECEVSGLMSDPLLDYAKLNLNLIITPHLGGASHEAMEQTEIFIANRVIEYVTDQGL